MSGSGISWAVSKFAPRSREITMSAPHHLVSYRPDALPATQPTTVSKHWRHWSVVKRSVSTLKCRYKQTQYCYAKTSADLCSSLSFLSQQPILRQWVSGLGRHSVHGSFLGLVLDGFVQHEQRLVDVRFKIRIHAQRQPVRQHLLDHRFRPATVTKSTKWNHM